VGKQLICELISQAKCFRYKYMRLDTLPSMITAIKLYQSLGFYEIAAYRYNPIAGALFMEKQLI
jgi:putative acetyltransferase